MNTPIQDHPLRYALANELHARPFPVVEAPGRAAYLALKPAQNAAGRDREADRAHLLALLDRYGVAHPAPDATHYFGQIGRHWLKWESHTEFVTYTIFGQGVADRPYDAATFNMFPEDWLQSAPGSRITSALIRIEPMKSDDEIAAKTDEWFVPESLALSRVLDGELVIAADFRIDSAGHMRFAIFADPECGARRIGRVMQRLCEIETYKTMSMLGLARARQISGELGRQEVRLSELVTGMANEEIDAADTLQELLEVSAGLERMVAETSFRFGATGAYETIVHQRIGILREERFGGRQTFSEFMMRRFDPAMRTVKSTEARLHSLSARAIRAGELLRTRVDVERSAQNQALLKSMDERSDVQLRLQRTVEGLSVVAISYYAVSLVLYVVGPAEKVFGIAKYWLAAGVTPVVVICVWLMLRRIQKSMH
ncbi:hypothetical protein BVC71_12385 [Marivivens niveibacter]|uniref:Egg lysin n=1 Tax=Marivivens niveibacter TaxID=1930667 RepID=A0A251WW57_9RHOB|nr:DUF3422 domain-containing protein [Marivivens niveibacter]OUD08720.1 hypothetical protein BVC71_12385 [Marivivens niveibacter]